MNLCPSTLRFLETEDAARIRDWLVEEVEDPADGYAAMKWLADNRLEVRNSVLCYFYDVACYQVGGSCFAAEAPANEQSLWFISVPAYSDMADGPELPLQPTLAAAEAYAVEAFELTRKFFDTAEVTV